MAQPRTSGTVTCERSSPRAACTATAPSRPGWTTLQLDARNGVGAMATVAVSSEGAPSMTAMTMHSDSLALGRKAFTTGRPVVWGATTTT
eukprot:CAMPEP_0175905084 /NCGR_PEP_ID=MMETSP0108-20121206/4823_1 /TAXON_ID=195067 ORGANISM="Goniomonas pacifica, Strain CCMP1869" /NCGR_SAMPLE_ID=MMETSP0108 /ASSEMBLY_ACC=CAM_ASM_000204 /LENGTH=89 /DNA_ID=CAMNT_0017226943 /DNA_START=17 /DNA_END=282 /DNA_ORIENTATION=+